MAIQVSGTQVISNARALTNIASLDATTIATITAAGVGGVAAPEWNPANTPNVNYTSSTTWTKPGTIGADDWVVFYLVGGGGSGGLGGSWSAPGMGASAVIFAALGQHLPSTVAFTVGAGGVANTSPNSVGGGNTTCTINGKLFVAGAGVTYSPGTASISNPDPGSLVVPYAGNPKYAFTSGDGGQQGGAAFTLSDGSNGSPSTFGGGSGATNWSGNTSSIGGVSTYAGNGGRPNASKSITNGGVPGGGGAGIDPGQGQGSNNGNGGSGSVRIWYI